MIMASLNEGQPFIVLLAEDDEDDYLLARDAFREAGSKVELRRVTDGEDLVAYLHHQGAHADAKSSPRPHVILLDLNMPKKDGREVLKELKADPELRQIPVVVMTTSSSQVDVFMSYQLGANSYVRKPLTFEELCETVKNFEHYWFNLVSLPARS